VISLTERSFERFLGNIQRNNGRVVITDRLEFQYFEGEVCHYSFDSSYMPLYEAVAEFFYGVERFWIKRELKDV